MKKIIPVLSSIITIIGIVWWLKPSNSVSSIPNSSIQAVEITTIKPRTLAQQTPGSQQPVAPGYQPPSALPSISLNPKINEVKTLEYLSNGFIEVANALVLIPKAKSKVASNLVLIQLVVKRTFETRPSLAEVDVSLYLAEGYAGFGGPSPLITVSVPSSQRANFLQLKMTSIDEYNRIWVNPMASPLPPQVEPTGETPTGLPENSISFIGTPQDLALQQAQQKKEEAEGGQKGGAYYHGNPRRPMAALTFDDAVHPMYAPLIYNSLQRTSAKATFFVVGRNIEAYPYFVRDLAKAGHEIANHTYHHVRLTNLTSKQIRDELTRTNQLIKTLSGETVRFFRPPGGRYSREIIKIASSLGLTTAFWTDDPADFNNPGAKVLETRFLKFLRKGGIILLHDNAPQTAPLLADFVNDARQLGIELVTLETLATP